MILTWLSLSLSLCSLSPSLSLLFRLSSTNLQRYCELNPADKFMLKTRGRLQEYHKKSKAFRK